MYTSEACRRGQDPHGSPTLRAMMYFREITYVTWHCQMYDWSGPAQITDQVCDWSGPAQITDQTVMQGCAYLDLCINTSICLHNYICIYIYTHIYSQHDRKLSQKIFLHMIENCPQKLFVPKNLFPKHFFPKMFFTKHFLGPKIFGENDRKLYPKICST